MYDHGSGLDNVLNVLQSSSLVKKLPTRKSELLHAFFRADSLARTKGEPIAMWLVRCNEQLGNLNRVGLDIVISLQDVAGWQALNLAGLTDDRIERVVSQLPDDSFPLDAISVELNRVFASVHMSEHVSSTPAIPQPLRFLLVVPGAQTSENVSHEIRVLIIAGDSPDPHLRQREHKINLPCPHSGTLLRRLSTLRTDNDGSDTIDLGDLQEYVRDELEVLATCMDNGESDAPIPGVDNPEMETACLKLAELPEALAIVQAAWRGASDSNRHSRASPFGKGKSRQPFGRQRVSNSARDQRQSDDRPAQVVGRTQRPRPQPQQRRVTDLQAKLDKRKARSVCHAFFQNGHWAGDPQCPEFQEFEAN